MEFNFKLILIILIGLLLLSINIIIANFQPYVAISITTILLPIVITGINFTLYKENFDFSVGYSYTLLYLNDLIINNLPIVNNSLELKELISLTTLLTFSFCSLILFVYAFTFVNSKEELSKSKKVFHNFRSLFIFGIMTGLLLYNKL